MKTILLLNKFGGAGSIMEYLSRLQRKGVPYDLIATVINTKFIEEQRYESITAPYVQVPMIPDLLEGFETGIEEIATTLLQYVVPGETVLLCCLVQEQVARAIATRIGTAVDFIGSIV